MIGRLQSPVQVSVLSEIHPLRQVIFFVLIIKMQPLFQKSHLELVGQLF
jgi:hypothetical protein